MRCDYEDWRIAPIYMVQSSNPRNPLTDKSPPWGIVDQPGADWQSGRSKLPVSSDLARKGVGQFAFASRYQLDPRQGFCSTVQSSYIMVD